MIVFGIDPGTYDSAIVAFDGHKISFKEKMGNLKLLAMLRSSEEALRGKRVVIEMIGHYGTGMPAGKEVFETCIMIGRIREAVERHGAAVTTVLRKTVAAHLCGNARAGDGPFKQALKDKYGDKGTVKNPGPLFGMAGDLWSALAICDWALSQP